MALARAMERVPTLDRGEVEGSNIKAAAAWDWGLIAGAILDAAEKHGLIRGWRRS
jgi:hypothetical protein